MIRKSGSTYFNPDELARDLRQDDPDLPVEKANQLAWEYGKSQLEEAVANRLACYNFETTLGGDTITQLLEHALENGNQVHIWYVGLESPELCITRVQERVNSGGHDIPEAAIRRRYDRSLLNLIRLMPKLTRLRVFDNSIQGDPKQKATPSPRLLLEMAQGQIVFCCSLPDAPEWVKPLLLAAMQKL